MVLWRQHLTNPALVPGDDGQYANPLNTAVPPSWLNGLVTTRKADQSTSIRLLLDPRSVQLPASTQSPWVLPKTRSRHSAGAVLGCGFLVIVLW
jgi:hypothetical protein